MSILSKNLEFLSTINQKLADKLRIFDEEDQYNSSSSKRNPSVISYDCAKQIKELIYLQCGQFSIGNSPHGLSEESDVHNTFKKCFELGSISKDTYSSCYEDVHEDLHIAYFLFLIKKRAAELEKLKFTKLPHRRVRPNFLVLNGLAGREDLTQVISEVMPKHIFAVENDIELVHDFVSTYSIEELRNHCKSLGNISFSLSIGCGSPDEHINELKGWVGSINELATEGLLISNSPTPSIKKEAMKNFLTTNTWHIDAINNMGYQVDEYNMLANTAANFNSLKHRVYLAPYSNLERLNHIPIVITGSGPSLDSSIDSTLR